MHSIRSGLLVLFLVHDFVAAQSPSIPRWGQAAAIVQDTLFIHGGRTDQYNSYSYSAAPVTNDLFSLSLTTSFDTSSPPWQYIGGCTNCTASQGPAVAWHTLSPVNTTDLLLFGGDPGPNSPIELPVQADSAALLDVGNKQDPVWQFETKSWANEPLRRIYHTATSAGGKVWIIGGSKADGSDSAFSEHFVFDPSGPSFTQLPSSNGPPDIYGHSAVLLANGWLLVMGGYSPSQKSLMPFSTIWVIDTTKSDTGWATLSVSAEGLPSPRRGFAATALDGGKVLIHGGADAQLQDSMNDGWVLDTSKNPAVWTSVDALSQLGPRRDHFALAFGNEVLFGYGYANNGPAPTGLIVFDVTSGSIVSSFSPPASGSIPTTLPGSSPTGTSPSQTQPTAQPSGSSSPTLGPGTGTGTASPSDPTSSIPPGNNGGNGSPNDPNGASENTSHTTAITLGTVFGVIALMVGAVGAGWYFRRRRSQDSFHLLSTSGDGDEDGSPHSGPAIPVAGARVSEKGPPLPPLIKNVKNRLSVFVPGQNANAPQTRRDMLADEDTREFDWWGPGLQRDTSSGRSSWRRPTLGDRVQSSLVSLRSVGGAMLDYAAGVRKEGSAGSKASAWRREKDVSDPFEDDWSLLKPASRPRGGRQASSHSYNSYADPFEDYDVESLKFDNAPAYHDNYDPESGVHTLSDSPPRSFLHAKLPAATATIDLTRLTPVSERPSLSTVTEGSSSHNTSSQSVPLSLTPFGTIAGGSSSSSSHEVPRSPTRRPSSIIDANQPLSAPMRRSNSWWARFAKTPLLDRRSSDASRHTQPLDFRDPNPPPSRLVPIKEANTPEPTRKGTDSRENSGDSGVAAGARRSGSGGHAQLYSTHAHGRSASSLQTSKTANSEMLERIARTMDIVQQGSGGTVSSHSSEPSMSSIEEDVTSAANNHKALSVITGSSDTDDPGLLVQSPEAMHAIDFATIRARSSPSPPSRTPPTPSRRQSTPPTPSLRRLSSPGGKVADRVQAYERRMSQTIELAPKSPPPARSKRRSVYGVAPKPSLFVANPDRSRSSSTDS
ncbi:hypothetical protein K474DRAFT_1772852 [Panus rudis PR-1116 ss-1]|nr:hypothetical protein K474DRAFT_1772852 [Panus rudis PR-1116 ss-1]